MLFSLTISAFAPVFLLFSECLPSPYNKLQSMIKATLNPTFVDWLMGWRPNWSSAERVFSAEEMEVVPLQAAVCFTVLARRLGLT